MSIAASEIIAAGNRLGVAPETILALIAEIDAKKVADRRAAATERQRRKRECAEPVEAAAPVEPVTQNDDVTHVTHVTHVTRSCVTEPAPRARVVISNPPTEDSYIKNPPSEGKKGRDLSVADRKAGEAAAEVLRSAQWPDTAPAVHAHVADLLRAAGFAVEFEVWVDALENGRRGRIDLVGTRAGGRVAIELDARRPRLKSIQKLRTFSGYRLIGLRGVDGLEVDGIDAIVCVPVRVATGHEQRDRRTVSRGTRIADDWEPDEAGIVFASDTLGSPQAAWREVEKFRDYWRSVPGPRGVKLDWLATWRNWVRRSAETAAQRAPLSGARAPPERFGVHDAMLEMMGNR